ncbi:MAG: carbohydrate ABC transporter permease [Candidatus Baldrarchaeia archaeon]
MKKIIWAIVVFIIPLQIIINLLGLVPFGLQLYISFTNWSPIFGEWYNAKFIGLANYISLLNDNLLISAFMRTFILTACCLVVEFFLGLGLALLCEGEFKGKTFFRSVFMLPVMIVPVVAGWMFYLIFLSDGPINAIIGYIIGHSFNISWLTNTDTALIVISLAEIWQWTPFIFIIILAGLMSIPPEPIEAAIIDGADSFNILRHIKIPLLKRYILVALVLRSIDLIKLFDAPWILTRGGPGYSTQTFSIYIYQQAFLYGKLSYSSAISIFLWLVFAVLGWYLTKPLRRSEGY